MQVQAATLNQKVVVNALAGRADTLPLFQLCPYMTSVVGGGGKRDSKQVCRYSCVRLCVRFLFLYGMGLFTRTDPIFMCVILLRHEDTRGN